MESCSRFSGTKTSVPSKRCSLDTTRPCSLWAATTICPYSLRRLFLQPRTYSGQHPHEIAAMQSGSSPEIPALRISGDVTELNVDVGRRLLHSPLPARNRHGRGIELLPQLGLAYAHTTAESNDP